MLAVHVRSLNAFRRSPSWVKCGVVAGAVFAGGFGAWAIVTDMSLVDEVHDGAIQHVEQEELVELVSMGLHEEAFDEAFEEGNELFETLFNSLDGVGANVGNGERFTRVPRADLRGSRQWFRHFPARLSGPNAAKCTACHNTGGDDGSGGTEANIHRDPTRSGDIGKFIQRNTPHLFGAGGIQLLAEEMTAELHALVEEAKETLCETGGALRVDLVAKGVSFGSVLVRRTRRDPCRFLVDASRVEGIDEDLVVRPFQWKGSVAFLRDFNRDAAHNELGMQSTEIVGEDTDGDYDGIVNEMTVGDQTALAVYVAAQPRPVTKIELNDLGLLAPALTPEQIDAIGRGEATFQTIGCATCHVPSLVVANPIFSEPSQNPFYRDDAFPAGEDPLAEGVDPVNALTFDITEDQPDNDLALPGGGTAHIAPFEADGEGGAIVRLYGDLKRHDMGSGLAEVVNENGIGRSTFLTENLWGVGTTSPYLHDGRATTLAEAILEHGGEAAFARTAFRELAPDERADLIAFLENLVLFKVEDEEE